MRIRSLAPGLLVLSVSVPALAQFAPGMGPMPGPGGGAPQGQEKQGPAEQAPPQATAPTGPTAQGWPTDTGTQFIQIDGLFRLRSNYYHQLDLGLPDGEFTGAPTPFPSPLDCWKANVVCGNHDISSSDMRLRLEPTINVTESVRVKAQIDVLDNVVLGSTPAGQMVNGQSRNGWTPINAFSTSQVAPEVGLNSAESSIHAKRAWAEVRTALGQLEFGRMPSNWGLGILANDGGALNADVPHECFDCDYGDSADRVMFATKLSGYLVALGRDWVADGPTSSITPQFETQYVGGQGQPLELYNPADVRQYLAVVGNLDRPAEFAQKVLEGGPVLNWGFYGVYRWQYYDFYPDAQLGKSPVSSASAPIYKDNAWAVIPDAYFHLGWGHLDVQGEAVGIFGHIDSLGYIDTSLNRPLKVMEGGAVLRGEYKLLDNDLTVGTEIGWASGDEAEATDNDPNVFHQPPVIEPTGDNIIANFRFNPAFQPDQILFRQILGTVTNATYFKPYAYYTLSRPTPGSPESPEITGRLDVELAFANVPVSTPGNAAVYGLEPDATVSYYDHRSGFTASLIYGVLFPIAFSSSPGSIWNNALSRPAAIFGGSPNSMGTGGNGGNAQIAQSLRLLLGVVY